MSTHIDMFEISPNPSPPPLSPSTFEPPLCHPYPPPVHPHTHYVENEDASEYMHILYIIALLFLCACLIYCKRKKKCNNSEDKVRLVERFSHDDDL
jgi:hypothetical protein